MKRWGVVTAAVMVCACGGSPPEEAVPDSVAAPAAVTALEIELRLQEIANSRTRPLWPGFDPVAVPLAVFDSERTLLFRHPAPPEGFEPWTEGPQGSAALDGRHEAVTANSSAEIGGVATATLLLGQSDRDRSVDDLAAVAAHEAFHVYQREHHPDWIANEADLFVYPVESVELLTLRRLETEALRAALEAGAPADAECSARRAVDLRARRYALMEAPFAAYERGTELNEGLARYVQMLASGAGTVRLPSEGFAPADVRLRAYSTGAALALLLDRFAPDWKTETGADGSLDGALARALGSGEPCGDNTAAAAPVEAAARADIAALSVERRQRLAAFEDRPGWRVVIEAGDGAPLWPQGFDPLNVESLGEGRVLHERYLELGNDAGRVQVLDVESLTAGLGSHPLFQGVRRLTITGLDEPEVSEFEGRTIVTAAGLEADFADAAVTLDAEVVTLRLQAEER